jgi:hypothetical protein
MLFVKLTGIGQYHRKLLKEKKFPIFLLTWPRPFR